MASRRSSNAVRSRLSAGSGKPLRIEELVFVDSFSRELPHDPLTPPPETNRAVSGNPSARKASLALSQSAASSAVNINILKDADSIAATSAAAAGAANPARTPRAVRSAFLSFVTPETGSSQPILVIHSSSAIASLGLDPAEHKRREFVLFLSGARLLPRSRSWAAAYAGHQFGMYSGQLGDGRCVSLGEAIGPRGASWEVQLKGAGLTPYSRFGDGAAGLRACVKEFIAQEYMAAVGIPTVRSVAVVATGVPVYRSSAADALPGAVLTRMAPSWIRFGTFELFHYRNDKTNLRLLADYVIGHHFPDLLITADSAGNDDDDEADSDVKSEQDSDHDEEDDILDDMTGVNGPVRGAPPARRLSFMTQPLPEVPIEGDEGTSFATPVARKPRATHPAPLPAAVLVDVELNVYARFFQEVIRRTAELLAQWQAIGFVHGALNTDNMSILGLTLDYGPFAFLDVYDPFWSSNEADHIGRYRFEHQPQMALWNLSKLGRTLAHLIAPPPPASPAPARGGSLVAEHVVRGEEIVRELLKGFEDVFMDAFASRMRAKLGISPSLETDLAELIEPLLQIVLDAGADYTCFFRALCDFRRDRGAAALGVLIRGARRLSGEESSEVSSLEDLVGKSEEDDGLSSRGISEISLDVGDEDDADEAVHQDQPDVEREGITTANEAGGATAAEGAAGDSPEVAAETDPNSEVLKAGTDEPTAETVVDEEVAPSGDTEEETTQVGTITTSAEVGDEPVLELSDSHSPPPDPVNLSSRTSSTSSLRTSNLAASLSGAYGLVTSDLANPPQPPPQRAPTAPSIPLPSLRARWSSWCSLYARRLETCDQFVSTVGVNPLYVPRTHMLDEIAQAACERAGPKRRPGRDGEGDPDVERALRIVVGDCWGEREALGGWETEQDIECAKRWRGEPNDVSYSECLFRLMHTSRLTIFVRTYRSFR
ncbi:hypothetical protein HKX48_003394 [Thoreauomyces humboldtii]|nr:hypothetical protein HKX48_003394 [Thoreauomyces humboldtii]